MASNNKLTKQMIAAMTKIVTGDDTPEVHLSDIVRHDGPGIQIPADMELDNAIDILTRKRDEEEEMTTVFANIPAFPYDGAHALKVAMERLFGYVVSKRCGCGRNHNTELKIVVDAKGTMVTVPWGKFEVPGLSGHIQTSAAREGKHWVFAIQGEIKGKHKAKFDALVETTKQIALNESIYRGKAFRVKFKDEYNDSLPVPEINFLDVSTATEPIYRSDLQEQFNNDVLSYITHSELVRPLNGGTLKRGVLFAGPYGTGKTLAATWVARKAVENQWTYIYVTDPTDFYDAHLLARAYQPAVIFVEDVDKIAGTDRTVEVDKMLNVLDGTDTKKLDIMCFFTTNHGDKITEAMYRPGRIDFLFRASPPDAEAAIKIAITYAQGRIEGTPADFTEAGQALDGMIPPTIKEAVARAQIRAVIRTGDKNAGISNTDLVAAAQSIERERNTYKGVPESEVERMGKQIGQTVLHQAGMLLSANGRS